MIEILPQSTQSCLVVRLSGKISGQEYQQFLQAIQERMNAGGPVNLVVELKDFEFYGDLEAAKDDVKFAFGEYRHIHRAAFVGDQNWIGWLTRFMGPFTHTEEKHFPAGHLDAAVDWASE
jgi:hypothetical protein